MILGALILSAIGLSAAPDAVALDNPVVVQLHGANGGGSGSATLFGLGTAVVVDVELGDKHDTGQAVAIVNGSCGHIGPGAFALTSTVEGQSETEIPHVTLAQVAAGRRALVVRRGSGSGAPALACGDIKD